MKKKPQMPRLYTVIVGDLVSSRHIDDRAQVVEVIEAAMASLAEEYRAEFVAPPVLTQGMDEFSAVMYRPARSYSSFRALNERVYPYAFRAAIVNGTIDVHLESGNASRMDGPAFHRAAAILEDLRKKDRICGFALAPEGISDSPWARLSDALTELANLTHTLQADRTDTMRQICRLYDKLGKQVRVAEEKRISQPAVSDILSQAHYRQVRDAHVYADAVLAAWPESGE